MSNTSTKGTGVIAAALLVIVLLPSGYMGAYYAMLDDTRAVQESADGWAMLVPSYRLQGEAVECFFRPAHEVDQWLRPGYW